MKCESIVIAILTKMWPWIEERMELLGVSEQTSVSYEKYNPIRLDNLRNAKY